LGVSHFPPPRNGRIFEMINQYTSKNGPKNKFDIFWKYCSSKLNQIYFIIIFY
jgi:hypothetical protein